MYELRGEEYAGDNVYIELCITKGDKAHCERVKTSLQVDMQYFNMYITKM